MDTLRGHLLIAGAGLWDPSFRRAVVLVASHDEDGAVGLVLNRVAPVTVEEAVPALAELVPDGEHLLLGGPVQPTSAVVGVYVLAVAPAIAWQLAPAESQRRHS